MPRVHQIRSRLELPGRVTNPPGAASQPLSLGIDGRWAQAWSHPGRPDHHPQSHVAVAQCPPHSPRSHARTAQYEDRHCSRDQEQHGPLKQRPVGQQGNCHHWHPEHQSDSSYDSPTPTPVAPVDEGNEPHLSRRVRLFGNDRAAVCFETRQCRSPSGVYEWQLSRLDDDRSVPETYDPVSAQIDARPGIGADWLERKDSNL